MSDQKESNAPSNSVKEVPNSARQKIIELFAKRLVKNATEKAQKPIQQLCDNLPSDAQAIRKLPFYDSTLQAIQWQRDNYLVGKEYAERRTTRQGIDSPSPRMPFDATALGNLQIVKLGSWFVPSTTVKDALLPIVISLPSGALREPILNTTVNAIPLAQPLVDRAVKNAMLEFMDNPHWRQVIKNQSNRYMVSSRDETASQQASSTT
jgi:hypothetical protein